MTRAHRLVRSIVLTVTVLSLLLPGIASADATTEQPFLSVLPAQSDTPGRIFLTGAGFTPSGLVYLALFDQQQRAAPGELRLTSDSLTAYGTNGSVDPAAEPGGRAFGAAFGYWLPATRTISGPYNNADPAVGYVHGGNIATSFRIPCGATLAVRAFDQTAGLWSTWADADPGC
jgi:hypothetical protein